MFTHVAQRHPALVRVSPLIVAALVAGSATGAVHVDSVSSGYRSTVVFSDGPGDRWLINASPTTVALSADALGLDWHLRLTHDHATGDLKFSDPEGLSMADRAGSSELFAGQVRLFDPATTIGFQAGFGDGAVDADMICRYQNDRATGWVIGTTVRPIDALAMSLHRGQYHPEPAVCRLFYEFDDDGVRSRVGGDLHWSMPVWMTTVELAVAPTDRLRLHSTVRDADLTPTAPREGGDPAGLYRATLEGVYCDGTVGVEYQLNDRLTASAGYRRLRLSARVIGYDAGMMFAYFGVVQAEAESRSFGIRYRQWSIDGQAGSGTGALMGDVESSRSSTGYLVCWESGGTS